MRFPLISLANQLAAHVNPRKMRSPDATRRFRIAEGPFGSAARAQAVGLVRSRLLRTRDRWQSPIVSPVVGIKAAQVRFDGWRGG